VNTDQANSVFHPSNQLSSLKKPLLLFYMENLRIFPLINNRLKNFLIVLEQIILLKEPQSLKELILLIILEVLLLMEKRKRRVIMILIKAQEESATFLVQALQEITNILTLQKMEIMSILTPQLMLWPQAVETMVAMVITYPIKRILIFREYSVNTIILFYLSNFDKSSKIKKTINFHKIIYQYWTVFRKK